MLRRVGDLWHANAEEITGWLMRETGAIGPFGGFQVMTSAEECYEAAALASAPYGELLRSAQPRLSHGAPGAGRRGRRDLAVQRADDPRPSARSRRRSRSATRCCSSPTRARRSAAARCSRALFEEAGLPAGVLHVLPGGADVGEALVTEPLVRVISFTGSTRAGRRGRDAGRAAPQAGAPRARRQLGADRARRRRPGRGVVRGGLGFVPHQGQVCMTTGRHLVQCRRRRRVRRGAGRAGRPGCRSATRRPARSRSAR